MNYSIIVPIYNDGFMAEDFCMEIQNIFRLYIRNQEIENEVELIFVNDGSNNDSIFKLIAVSEKYSFVKIIDLSRNFGQHIALSCGYEHSTGNYVGMLNVDMQDPPDQLPVLIDFMKANNHDIVFGLREYRNDSWFIKTTSYLFNITLNKLTGNKTPLNVTTLRVMNRRFVNAYNSLSEKSRFLPGLETWLGFSHGYIKTRHQKRTQGKSSYNFTKRLLMAVDSIISFSDIPLKLIAITGMLIATTGFILTLLLIIDKIFFREIDPGYTSTLSSVVFMNGIEIFVMGIAALYIGKILKEVQNRPLYVIKDKYKF